MPNTKIITFNLSFDRLLGHEGGYVNDQNDPGGETNWGISKRSYPTLDIKNLTREVAKKIYLNDFWNVVTGVPDSVKFQVFDAAVNHGITAAIRMLQRAVGVADDGKWGTFSSGTAATKAESDILMLFIAERAEYFTRLMNWPNHGKGWIRKRICDNLRFAAQDNEV
jgi:lysozyme family protein